MSDDARAHLTGLLAWHRRAPHDLARLALLAEPGALYAVVDVARDPDLLELLAASGEAYCALDETREPDDLGETAPVVVVFTPGAESLPSLLEHAWGEGAAVFFVSGDTFPVAYREVLLRAGVEPERTSPRFWDPAALRAALDAGDVTYFDRATAWLAESPGGASLVRYALVDGRVAREEIALR